jgi:hypothetical protein
MFNFLAIATTVYLLPALFIAGTMFYFRYSDQFDEDDEESMAEHLHQHFDDNLLAYITLQTLFYFWLYFVFFG